MPHIIFLFLCHCAIIIRTSRTLWDAIPSGNRFEVCFPEIMVVAHKIEHNIRSFNADAPQTALQCVEFERY